MLMNLDSERTEGPTGPIAKSALNNYQMRGDTSMQNTNPQSLFEGSSLGEMFTGIMDGIFRTGGGQDSPVNLQTPVRSPNQGQQQQPGLGGPIDDDQQWFRDSEGDLYKINADTRLGNKFFDIDKGGENVRIGQTHNGMDMETGDHGQAYYGATGGQGAAANSIGQRGGLLSENENTLQNRLYALENAPRPEAPAPGPAAPAPEGAAPSAPMTGNGGPPPMVDVPPSTVGTPPTGSQPAAGPNAWGMMDMSGGIADDFISGLMNQYGRG